MYSRFQLIKKYLRYWFSASNGRGHGIHSPFVYDFVRNVLKDKKEYPDFPIIEAARQMLLIQTGTIEVEDPGAGSAVINTSKRAVADIARSSLKQAKYAQLLYRIVQYYKPKTILELGTSLGVTTAYLAAGDPNAKVYTIEGSGAIAGIARQTFERVGLKNIELIEGDFNDILPGLLSGLGSIELVFIDGNHRKEPTLDYFRQLAANAGQGTILIFDDIHWSREMEEAWALIRQHPSVKLSIDLFFIGIVSFNPDINHKQDFKIRF